MISATNTSTIPSNPIQAFLKKAGTLFEQGVAKVLPFLTDATEVAEAAEPIIDLALPMEGPLFNTCVAAAIQAEQQGATAAAAGGAGTSGDRKLANVVAVVGPILTDQLAKNGVTGDAATKSMTSYVNAIVALLNGPVATAAASATAPAVAASAASQTPADTAAS